MSKNKPMTRIDLDYNKDLKYPDINDYLKDSMYASNLTEYPDNQRNAALNMKAIPNSLKLRQIQVGENKALIDVWLADMKMYGYNPEVEMLDRMELVIDFLDDGDTSDPERTKVIPIYKKGTKLNLDLVTNSEIQADKLPSIVNYSVAFPIESVITIYNYVFGSRAVQAKRYFTDASLFDTDIVETQVSDEDFQTKFLDHVYQWEIPVKIQYYNGNSQKPNGHFGLDFSLKAVLPQYRKQIELTYSSIGYNTFFDTAKLDVFTCSWKANQECRIKLIAKLTDTPSISQTESDQRNTNEDEMMKSTTDLLAYKLATTQHSSYYVTYPEVTFTYNMYVSADNTAELSKDVFDTYRPTVRSASTLTITSVKTGTTITRKEAVKNAAFYIKVLFVAGTTAFADQTTLQRYKFILDFKSNITGNLDVSDLKAYLSTSTLPAFSVAGNLGIKSTTKRVVTANKEQNNGVWFHKSVAVLADTQQVFGVYNRPQSSDAIYSHEDLAKANVSIRSLKTEGTLTTYELLLTWPSGINLKSFSTVLKARFVKLTIGNFFQEPLKSGGYKRPLTDIYTDDSANPLLTSLSSWRPNYDLKYYLTTDLVDITEAEKEAINNIVGNPNGKFFVKFGECKTKVVADISNSSTKTFNIVTYTPRTYVALSASEPADVSKPSVPYFCFKGIVMHALTPPGKAQTFNKSGTVVIDDANGKTAPTLPIAYDAATGSFTISADPVRLLALMRAKSGAAFAKGLHKLYYILSLNYVGDADGQKVYTNAVDGEGRQLTTLVLVVQHTEK